MGFSCLLFKDIHIKKVGMDDVKMKMLSKGKLQILEILYTGQLWPLFLEEQSSPSVR